MTMENLSLFITELRQAALRILTAKDQSEYFSQQTPKWHPAMRSWIATAIVLCTRYIFQSKIRFDGIPMKQGDFRNGYSSSGWTEKSHMRLLMTTTGMCWSASLKILSILRPENHPLERVDERASAKTMLEQN